MVFMFQEPVFIFVVDLNLFKREIRRLFLILFCYTFVKFLLNQSWQTGSGKGIRNRKKYNRCVIRTLIFSISLSIEYMMTHQYRGSVPAKYRLQIPAVQKCQILYLACELVKNDEHIKTILCLLFSIST